jgi:hypothetical protein
MTLESRKPKILREIRGDTQAAASIPVFRNAVSSCLQRCSSVPV